MAKFSIGDRIKHRTLLNHEAKIIFVGNFNYFMEELPSYLEFSDSINIVDHNYDVISSNWAINNGATYGTQASVAGIPCPLPRGMNTGFYGASISPQLIPIATPQESMLSCNCHQPLHHAKWCNANPD